MINYLFVFVMLVGFGFVPIVANAAVIINEIAWMGDTESANHEWIELRNTEAVPVNVDGWILSDGLNLEITLSGTIPASSYAVLERSSDEAATGAAFLIYTGALVNTGVTLTLRDSGGLIVDQVAGGESWQEIGGDNTTKDTAQYTSAGWVTDSPTPGAQNRSGRVEPKLPTTESVVSKTSINKPKTVSSSKGNQKPGLLVQSTAELNVYADVPDIAYVNQTISLTATGEGIGQTILNSLVYTWNFGDSYDAMGSQVEHFYAYPGTYVVTVNAKYATRDVTVRKEITVLPITFSITKNEVGDIQLHNDSPYDVDISGFSIKGLAEVVLPPRTIILPRGTITIAKDRLKVSDENLVAVYDTKHNIVTSTFTDLAVGAAANLLAAAPTAHFAVEKKGYEVVSRRSVESVNTLVEADTDANFEYVVASNDTTPSEVTVEGVVEEVKDDIPEVSKMEEVDKKKDKSDPSPKQINWPYLAFTTLLLFVITAMYFSRQRS
ncbi:MAG: lamin tail domain-containing protein [Candidatus Nomurabacteria bacterium]|nr:lamin tail domain-containing protein [Candidatus Nomurabacteria bacterium]USN88139.1 MAG: lamin tail domain-containing protein [Candidatus Nomurabacteria bacterium]